MHTPPGRPRSPEGDLSERERRKRERWRTYSAARHEALRPQREAERLARNATKAEQRNARPLTRTMAAGKTPARRRVAPTRPLDIPAGDKRPW